MTDPWAPKVEPDRLPMKCERCGQRVEVVTGDEGTQSYRGVEAAAVRPPVGTRLILASADLLSLIGTRNERGDRLTLEWGEPDQHGWYGPVITEHHDDNLVADAAADTLDNVLSTVQFYQNGPAHYTDDAQNRAYGMALDWVIETVGQMRIALVAAPPPAPAPAGDWGQNTWPRPSPREEAKRG